MVRDGSPWAGTGSHGKGNRHFPLLWDPVRTHPQGSLTMRAGNFVQQPTGYVAFEPVRLPPDPSIQFDGELVRLLSAADRALGRLDGITGILPNPNLFVAMYVRQEARVGRLLIT